MNVKRLFKIFKPMLFTVVGLFFYSASMAQRVAEIGKLQKQLPMAKDSDAYVNLLNKIGFLMHLKNADSCFYYGVKANAIAERINYSPGKADALANIAIGLTLKGLYSQSLSFYSRALTEYDHNGNHSEVAQMYMNSAITYSFLGDSVKMIQFARRAATQTNKYPPDSLASMLYANYANLNETLPADSIAYYIQKATDIARKYKDDHTPLYLDQIKADELVEKGKNEEALPYILSSLKLARANHWDYQELESTNIYAQYFLNKKILDSAIVQYNLIYTKAKANGFGFWQTEVLKSLLHCAELKHDEKEQARINKLLVSSLEQSTNNNSTFIGDYIAYTSTQQQLRAMGVVNHNNTLKIWLLVSLSAAGLAFTVLLFWAYKRARRHERELTVLNERVGLQNVELQQTDEFKGRLISMLAHDFRAPLASTISMIRLLKDGDDDDFDKNQLTSLYDLIETDIQNILITFDNILQWIRKQLSGYVFNPQMLSVHEMMEDASSMFKANMEVKQVTFKNEVPEGLSYFSDKEIVQFINRNLIHNALKFSPAGGTITVSAGVLNNELRVSVKDEGPGISESKLKTLFDFNTTQKADSIDKGAGIALTICKEFIGKINGRLWAESKEKKGTTFYYTLPVNTQKAR